MTDQETITRVTLDCPGFEGEVVTIVGPYGVPTAFAGEFVVRRKHGSTMAVRPRDVRERVDIVTCGACGRSWNDAASTSITPVPFGRCPFEYEHEEEDENPATYVAMPALPAEQQDAELNPGGGDLGWVVIRTSGDECMIAFGDGYMTERVATMRAEAMNAGAPGTDVINDS